ncbi:predicted protein [Uncinocarpus reesii 1704]|uniref:Uncharacterized protein n=1 Tax=Uncinocarpus reesii (strain UAMH 1704) TaxID=336963 RepID=C4JJH9_UNCRE|nr:uncharacterized protein UREG_01786 [Uncinocarpus reesii 1704]EEP76937.1 predicted protein [Uncinocarpus reesii 1704]
MPMRVNQGRYPCVSERRKAKEPSTRYLEDTLYPALVRWAVQVSEPCCFGILTAFKALARKPQDLDPVSK